MDTLAAIRTSFDSDHSQPRALSHGRGGAGNMKRGSKDFTEPDLVTPTIKTDVYTTGRGGTGNMAKNDPLNPELARESQDVNGLPRRQSEAETHFGRGGAANTVKPSEEEIAMAKEEKVGWEKKVKEQQQQPVPKDKADPKVPKEQRDVRGWADKGKDMLFGKNRRGSKG